MNRKQIAANKLGVLTGMHFTVDMLSGMVPGFLPVILEKYSLSVAAGSLLIAVLGFSCNGLQLMVGGLRSEQKKPLFIQMGLLLTGIICLIGFVPVSSGAIYWLLLLMMLTGFGVALVHPEGLRGVCAVDNSAIAPPVATSVFMLAGFLGCSCGPLVSSVLVELMGLKGLLLLLIIVLPLLYLFQQARVKLAMGQADKKPRKVQVAVPQSPLTFWEIFLLAVFINTGCMIVSGLLPTYLRLAQFSLLFSGLSAMLFGLGAGLSALYTSSVLIKRFPVVKLIKYQIMAGVPIMILYIVGAERSMWWLPLALISGVLVGAGFPQLVTLCRTAANGPALGTRMGLIVGGTWGVAGLLFLGVGAFADLFTLRYALLLSPLSFICAIILLIYYGRKTK